MLRILFLVGLLAVVARAEVPEIPGYRQTVLARNIPLPVRVVGVGVSEQDIPVFIYLPGPGAGVIEGAKPASAIPALPARAGGYRLMTIADTTRVSVTLRNGHSGSVDLPLFAYVPEEADCKPETLIDLLGFRASTSASPSIPPVAVVSAPAPATVVPASSANVFAPPPAQPAYVPSPSGPVVAAANPFEIALQQKASPTAAEVRVETQNQMANVPDIRRNPGIQAAAPVAESNVPAPATTTPNPTWDDVLADDFKFADGITVGDVIVDERQRLRNRLPVHCDFMGRSLSEVLLSLATASGIDFSLGALPAGDNVVTTRFTRSPFAALEQISKQFGVGVYHEKDDPLWVIRKVDPEALIMRTYSLQNISLGSSSGATADGKTFGPGFDGTGASSMMGGRGGSSGGYGNGSSGSGMSMGSSGNSMGGSGMNSSGLVSPISLPHETSTFGERFTQASDILFTIRSILAQVEVTPMTSDLRTADERGDAPKLSTTPSAPGAKANGMVSYNADTGTLLVIGTEKQQQWVAEYLKVVDRPIALIAIDAMFVESDKAPSSKMGGDWSGTFVDWNISGPAALSWGTLGHLKAPKDIAITSSGFGAKLSAFLAETKSRVARYPRVVTTNNREVRIATTSNIPIIQQAATVSGVTNGTGQVINNPQTNYTAGTQEIGTIITLLPTRVGNTDKVHLKISIEISSGAASSGTQGETLTGRIPTTSTTYEGEVTIPAGHTLAIGGLERIAESSSMGRVPGISKLPIFGFLFKKEEANFGNTNITLFVTPRFVDGNALPDASQHALGGVNRAISNSMQLEQRAAGEAAVKK